MFHANVPSFSLGAPLTNQTQWRKLEHINSSLWRQYLPALYQGKYCSSDYCTSALGNFPWVGVIRIDV